MFYDDDDDERASCEQRSSRLSAPVHGASWNISDASPYK